MRESKIEAYLRDRCRQREWPCLKLVNQSGRGFPDRTVLCGGGRVFFVELKAQYGRLSPPQKRRIQAMRDTGYNVWVADSYEAVDEILDILEPV